MRNDFTLEVKAANRARYYSALFAPEKYRGALLTLYAFDAEICRIPSLVSEPSLGAIRMQWWIDGLTGERSEELRMHPIGEALLDLEDQIHLPLVPLVSLIEERSNLLFMAQDDAIFDERTLESSIGKTHAVMFHLAAFILNNGRDPGTSDLSGHAGMALGLMEALRDQSLPIKALDLRALAFEHLEKARLALKTIKPELMSAYLPLAQIRPSLKRIPRENAEPHSYAISDVYLLMRMALGLV